MQDPSHESLVATARKPSTGLKLLLGVADLRLIWRRDGQKTQHGIETARSIPPGPWSRCRDGQKTQHGIETSTSG